MEVRVINTNLQYKVCGWFLIGMGLMFIGVGKRVEGLEGPRPLYPHSRDTTPK